MAINWILIDPVILRRNTSRELKRYLYFGLLIVYKFQKMPTVLKLSNMNED